MRWAANIALVLALAVSAGAQTGRPERGEVRFEAQGPSVLMGALDPTVMRWYMPQELFDEYGRRQWRYTNYATEPYRRYIDRNQEGSHFYDTYGKLVSRGWLVYDWRQTQARTVASSELTKERRYATWFNRLIISSDASGDYNYSLMIGDEIFATLTPMTFRKVGFNGVVTSLAGRHFRFTGLFARPSLPIVEIDPDIPTAAQDNFTSLVAGRLEADWGAHATLGLTLVNAHNGAGNRESFAGNPLKGVLTTGQLGRRLNKLIVRLSDDSPADGAGGPVLFSTEVEITTALRRPVPVEGGERMVFKDTTFTGSSIGFGPVIEGGEERGGFLRAEGTERIVLQYALAAEEGESEEGTLRLALQRRLGLGLDEADDAITRVKNVRFRLVLANDYRIEVASDRQNNRLGIPEFLVVTRAAGNVKNQLNPREVVFDYGLPTALQVAGITAEVRDWWGFDWYGEFNVSTQYRQFPSTTRTSHRSFSGIQGDAHAVGWLVNLVRHAPPWRFSLEGFGMDDAYATSFKPVDSRGLVDYSPEATDRLYDFVDDNDDQDRHPDQKRFFQGGLVPPQSTALGNFQVRSDGVPDPAVFPGYDENGDFISDFNQNRNFFPDYEEPFLRHHSDRPAFLFGMDLNNNGVAERFENDDLPDYPYKKDHWGYNAYISVEVHPQVRLAAGYLRQDLRQADRKNHTAYGLVTFERDWPGRGRVRVFDMLKKAADTIPDPLSQWIVPTLEFGAAGQTSGQHIAVPDLLAAEDTWINAFYAEWEYAHPRRWTTKHRFRWDWWHQRAGPARDGRETSGFVGLIDKIDGVFAWGAVAISPRFKSEFLSQSPFSLAERRRRSWDGIGSLLVRFPAMRNSELELGFEQRLFFELLRDEKALADNVLTGDFRGMVWAAQLSNQREYLGYELTTQIGLRFDRRSLEVIGRERETRAAGLAFLSIFASL